MDTATAIAQLTSLIGQRENELVFLKLALDVLNDKYTVSIKELEDSKATIASLEAQIQILQPSEILDTATSSPQIIP